jgi:hypothetical protein
MVFVNHRNRGIVYLLRVTPRLGGDRQRKSIDDEPQQNKIAEEAAQFFGAKPKDERFIRDGLLDTGEQRTWLLHR